MLTMLLCCKLITIGVKILEQNSQDLFFIDWEPARTYKYTHKQAGTRTVSPWRRLYLANEFSEL